MEQNENQFLLEKLASAKPSAYALIEGGEEYPNINGQIDFYDFGNSTIVVCSVHNLPNTKTNIFGFHIHEKGECDGDFSSSGGHYGGDMHPNHKGDMPVLFSGGGNAFLVFYTTRFTVDEVIDRSVIIHLDPDDYTSQPAGNSGMRIACGLIKKL